MAEKTFWEFILIEHCTLLYTENIDCTVKDVRGDKLVIMAEKTLWECMFIEHCTVCIQRTTNFAKISINFAQTKETLGANKMKGTFLCYLETYIRRDSH